MTDVARLTTPERRPEDLDAALRPKTLDEFIGQQARAGNPRLRRGGEGPRRAARPHVLFFSPARPRQDHARPDHRPRTVGVGFRATSGPVIAKSGDLAAILTNLEDGDVLFIDEICPRAGGRGDPLPGDGTPRPRPDDRRGAVGALGAHRQVHPGRRHYRQEAITTPLRAGSASRSGSLSTRSRSWSRSSAAPRPARPRADRGRRPRGRAAVARHPAHLRGGCCAGCATSPRRRSRPVDAKAADSALTRMEVDALGLDAMDRRYLRMIADIYKAARSASRPIAAGLSEPRDTIEEVISPT